VHGRVGKGWSRSDVKPSRYEGGKRNTLQNLLPAHELNLRLQYILPEHRMLRHKERYIIYRIRNNTCIVLFLNQLALLDALIKFYVLLNVHLDNLCNENQLDALFALNLFRQSTFTCFGYVYCI
jgi:hypothetical protein